MKPFTRWAVRTVALWALAKALEKANGKLKQRQVARQRRTREGRSAAATS